MTWRGQWLLFLVVTATAACAQAPSRTRPGIDVLLTDSMALVAGKRLGLITNPTGVDADGVPTIDRLIIASRSAPGTRLVALFAPEHGIRGAVAPGERVGDTTDTMTGLPIYSLYGANRSPTAAQLALLDVLVIDLQDVGARPFTYISTTVLSMRAARTAGKRVLVLDRPNPIGCAMQGPVLDTANASFIGMLPVPLRHGMTMGELARFANAEFGIGADLVVVPVRGWSRCTWFDQTGLPWIAPSPNLPSLEAVSWYPGTVLFEATSLSVGRGTSAPFRQVGAPWLRVPPESRTSEEAPVSPGDGKYRGVPATFLRFPDYDRVNNDDPVRYALAVLETLRRLNPDSLQVDARGMALRLGVAWDPARMSSMAGDSAQLEAFRRRAAPYLLYR